MSKNQNGDGAYRARAESELNKKLGEFIKTIEPNDTAPATAARVDSVSGGGKLPESVKRDFGALVADTHIGHRARLRATARNDMLLDGFRDAEILEMLLAFLIPQHDTAPLARRLLDRYGSLLEVLRAPAEQLKEYTLLNSNCIALLPTLAVMSLMFGRKPVFIKSHIDAAEYFGSLFVGSVVKGTFAVCISQDGRLLGIERIGGGEALWLSSVLAATTKYNTRNVILLRRERAILPNAFSKAKRVGKLKSMLKEIGIHMADFLLFTDYGYYTLGVPVRDDNIPQYIFVPIKNYAFSPELIDRSAVGGTLGSVDKNERIKYASAVRSEQSSHILRGLLNFKKEK